MIAELACYMRKGGGAMKLGDGLAALALGAALFFPVATLAQTVATCGDSAGHAYYPATKMTSDKNSGWQQDGIRGGRLTLTKVDAKDYDVLYADSMGRVVSSKQDGAAILAVARSGSFITVAVLYAGVSVETYTFYKDRSGRGHVAWTQNRFGGAIDKISAFVADCNFVEPR
jgi:hypothetical protein